MVVRGGLVEGVREGEGVFLQFQELRNKALPFLLVQ